MSLQMDPLTRALQPPASETPEETAARRRAAQAAHERSRRIDEGLLEDKKAHDRRRRAVKVLLLGQAESGKSTILKNFKLAFCPTQFKSEYPAWRIVIQLNLIRSVKTILSVLQEEADSAPPPSPAPTPRPRRTSMRPDSSHALSSGPSDEHRRLRMRLGPLLAIEDALSARLQATFPARAHWAGVPRPSVDGGPCELAVRAGADWGALLRMAAADDPAAALAACREDIVRLWADPPTRALLTKRGIRLELESGFFLDDADRVTRLAYEPTIEDILRARLKTVGIEEHHLVVENDRGAGQEWLIYDVNGSKNMRPRWVPYFDDVSAILFLAPLSFSAFLEEDPSTNRLDDSYQVWRELCRNKLLRRTTLVLLLNKRDVLARTLAAGEQVRRFFPHYTGANEEGAVSAFFKQKFVAAHAAAYKHRDLFVHETTSTDRQTTEVILLGVSHAILTQHLRTADLLY